MTIREHRNLLNEAEPKVLAEVFSFENPRLHRATVGAAWSLVHKNKNGESGRMDIDDDDDVPDLMTYPTR